MKKNESEEEMISVYLPNYTDEDENESVCDFSYLSSIMGGKKSLMIGIMDAFLKQTPEDLELLKHAITNTDYNTIKNISHRMKSSVSLMGISVLEPILTEIENSGASGIESKNASKTMMKKIISLHEQLTVICQQSFKEIKIEKLKNN